MRVLTLTTMRVLTLTTLFSVLVVGAASSSETAVNNWQVGANDETKSTTYLRQNNFVNPNDLIATSDSDADSTAASSSSSSNTAQWLFSDEEEDAQEVALSQDAPYTGVGPNWTVSGCCGKYEIIFLCCFAAYLVIIKLLWNTFIMKPMKLVAVFVHGECVRLESFFTYYREIRRLLCF